MLRREATGFYRAIHPLLGVLAAIERAAAPEVRPYLRDVQDTLVLVNEEVAAQQDWLSSVLEANMAVLSVEQASISNRQNATMEQLTILATIFLPLTFVTGFFGQNFGWLTGHVTSFATFMIYGIGGLLVPLLVLAALLSRLRRGTLSLRRSRSIRIAFAHACSQMFSGETLHAIDAPALTTTIPVALIRRRTAFQTGAAQALAAALTDWPHSPAPAPATSPASSSIPGPAPAGVGLLARTLTPEQDIPGK